MFAYLLCVILPNDCLQLAVHQAGMSAMERGNAHEMTVCVSGMHACMCVFMHMYVCIHMPAWLMHMHARIAGHNFFSFL